MIQKGIIESIVSAYEYKVRIPRYDKLATTPGGVSTEDLSSAIVCSTPGTKVAFAENDVVLVGFENDELNKPVILGLLYRENKGNPDQFNLPLIQSALDTINKNLNILNNSSLYAHIKYSNDNGTTFTSLYEYKDASKIYSGQSTYIGADDIIIDTNSNVIYWSIIDSNNVDITSNLVITTTLSTDDDPSLVESFSDTLINIPIRFKGLNNLKLSFRILQTSEYDNYHIVLTTDKNTLGSVYGDYMGICVSTDPIPPLIPSLYSWSSFYDPFKILLDTLENDLLPRIERNEKSLYGFTYSDNIQSTDSTGLLDGIRVEKENIYIHGAENKNIFFNTNNSMYIDNQLNNFTLKELVSTSTNLESAFSESFTNDGHLMLIVRKKV